ncbi:MAG TPA: M15 family metallopeptidase, partial [Pirellulales bacterium]
VYKPGTRTKYSNAGIAVVGEVVEQITGVPYSQRIEETILKPLGMTESNFVLTPEVDTKLATAWMWTLDGRRFKAPKFAIGTAPAGNMYSSVTDLAKFLSCIFRDGKTAGGEILSPETLKKMTTPPADSNGKPQGFAIGFHVGTLDGHKTIGHGGAVYGFSTTVEALPEQKLGVAAVAALDGANGVAERLAQFALRLMLAQKEGKPLPEYRTTTPIPPARAAELVGAYVREGFPATITELNGRVWLAYGDFCREVRAAADNGELLVDDPVGFGAKVALDEKHNLVLGDRTLERLPDEPPAPAPERWKGLIGEYGWDHNTLYILENRGQLLALIEWFYSYPLTEINENEFAFPDHGLYHGEKLFLTRDASGRATKVVAAEVPFLRREVGTKDGETYRIKPVKPIDELRATALAATPPKEEGEFLKSDLVELVTLDPTIKLDIRYATTNNFTGNVFYKQPRAFLQRAAAEALVRVNQRLKARGLGLLVHDAYRPWYVTKMFWDATPEEFKDFVANPAKGSRHNRGCAVDLTLYDLKTGQPIQMVAGYDEFSPRSFPFYSGGTSQQRWYRELLRRAMEAEGFTVYEFEWWHFDFKDWKKHSIGNIRLEEIPATTAN